MRGLRSWLFVFALLLSAGHSAVALAQASTVVLTYTRPSELLRAYAHPEVAKVGAELDPIFEKIAAQAVAAR